MPEPEKTESPDASKSDRSFSARAERSVKNADRLLKKFPDDGPPQQLAMAQLEQAKVWALLQLAEAIRENQKS